MQPGETVQPGENDVGATPTASTTPPAPAPDAPTPPGQLPEPVPAPGAPPSDEPIPAPDSQPVHSDEVASAGEDSISWSASEFMIHQKGGNWYLLLAGGTLVAAGAMWLITKDVVSTVVVGVVGVVFGLAAARQPRTLDYHLDNRGLHMGEKNYAYTEFKSFSVMEEGPIHTILLVPLKRYLPGVTIYYPPEQEDAIADALSLHLPHEDRKPDVVDRLMHKVRY